MLKPTYKPQHQHDCSRCTFLGSLATADFYCCQSPTGTSYVIRYSSEPSDNSSHHDFRNEELLKQDRKWGGSQTDRDWFLKLMTLFALQPVALMNLMPREVRCGGLGCLTDTCKEWNKCDVLTGEVCRIGRTI